MKASKFETILNSAISIAMILLVISLSVLGIYGGIEAEVFTLATLPLWIWNNGQSLYWIIMAISIGHCLVQLNAIPDEPNQSEKDKSNYFMAYLIVLILSGVLWPAYWSFMFFNSIYKKASNEEKIDKKETTK